MFRKPLLTVSALVFSLLVFVFVQDHAIAQKLGNKKKASKNKTSLKDDPEIAKQL